VGSGPVGPKLSALARQLQLQGRVTVTPTVHGEDVPRTFAAHDVLVMPSITEISPNTALEARASGLPVLLTEENGLSDELKQGMRIRPLITVDEITKAILQADQQYEEFAKEASQPFTQERGWAQVAEEHQQLFDSLR
jgi:glycosyltransferase involved in cell wall biosynthesis